jgi:hypothetical protein
MIAIDFEKVKKKSKENENIFKKIIFVKQRMLCY